METYYIPIPQNRETKRQVMTILALEKLKKEFNSMDIERKKKFIELYEKE